MFRKIKQIDKMSRFGLISRQMSRKTPIMFAKTGNGFS